MGGDASASSLKADFTPPTVYAMGTNGFGVQQAVQNMQRQAAQYSTAASPMLRNYFVAAASQFASSVPFLPHDVAYLDKFKTKYPSPPGPEPKSGGCCCVVM